MPNVAVPLYRAARVLALILTSKAGAGAHLTRVLVRSGHK